MVKITSDYSKLKKALKTIEPSPKTTKAIFQKIGGYQMRRFSKTFKQDKSPDGKKWTPLAESTKKRKKNKKMLVERIGRIPASLFFEATARSLSVGYGDPLAEVHNNGDPSRNLPARPLIGWTRKDIKQWTELAVEELEKDQ